MGARACMTGRPYLYALSAFGAPGVERWLASMHQETLRTMALIGCASIGDIGRGHLRRSEEHTSELQSLMRPSYAVFCLIKKPKNSMKNQFIYNISNVIH